VIPQKQILPKILPTTRWQKPTNWITRHGHHMHCCSTDMCDIPAQHRQPLLFHWPLRLQLLCDLSNNVTGLLWILCTNYTTIKGQLFEQIDNKNPRVSIRLPGKLSNGTSYVAAKYVVDGWSSAFCKQNLFLFIQPRWQLKRTISLITIMFCFNEFAFTV